MSGSKTQRPGLTEALAFRRSGDTLVVWRMGRFGRSLKEMIEMINQLHEKRIGLKSLQEAIDANSSSREIFFHIFGALAEFEQNPIRERTQAGLQAAKARGRKGRQPESLTQDKQVLAVKLYDEKQHTVT